MKHKVLSQIGGVFIDADYVCLKPFDEIAYRYRFVIGLTPF